MKWPSTCSSPERGVGSPGPNALDSRARWRSILASIPAAGRHPKTRERTDKMDHLSSMDAAFLRFETPEMPMHVGSLAVLDLPKGYTGDFYEDAKAYLAARLHLVGAFQRKLALMPFDLANPVWVDDDDMDIDHHIRHVILPRPGSFERLEQLVRPAALAADGPQPPAVGALHHRGPEFTGQVALYSKMHHAGIDGQAAVALAKVLYSDTAVPAPVKPPRARSRSPPPQLRRGRAGRLGAAQRGAADRPVAGSRSPRPRAALLDMLAPVSEADGKRRLGKLQCTHTCPRHAVECVDLQPARLCRALGAAGRDQGR